MGSDLCKLRKKQKLNQPFFEGEKSIEMGRGIRPWVIHSIKNNSSVTCDLNRSGVKGHLGVIDLLV